MAIQVTNMAAPLRKLRHLSFSKYWAIQMNARLFSANPPSNDSIELPERKYEPKDDISPVSSKTDISKLVGDNGSESPPEATHGLSKTLAMFRRLQDTTEQQTSGKKQHFATMLRNSKFIQLGDPLGRVATGTIFEVMNDDLYIDFGGKFHCVCPRPRGPKASEYRVGVEVRIRLQDLELSSRFIGADRDITLLEADAVLLGIHRKGPKVSEESVKQP